MKNKCSSCAKELNFWNTPNFGGGKLNDGGRVCRHCFKIMAKHDNSFGLKSKMKYSSHDVQNIISGNIIIDRPLPDNIKLDIFISEDENVAFDNRVEYSEAISLNTLFLIEYIDAKNNISKRRITIKKLVETKNDYLLYSYCHERKSIRSFKLSRIQELVDIETGEIIENPENFIKERIINESPLANLTKQIQQHYHELNLMVYMGRVDGYLHPREREIILNYLDKNSDNLLDFSIIDDEIRRMNCDSIQFRESLQVVSLQPNRQSIYNLLIEIAYSDNILDPLEEGILKLIKTEFEI